MIRWVLIGIFAVIVTIGGLIWGYTALFFDYARMNNDEAINLYELQMPRMPENTVPVSGGSGIFKIGDLRTMKNPLPTEERFLILGKKKYGYFCSHCHGPEGMGRGTVGQSFAPLPTDLRSPYVRQQSDGRLFYRISFGFRRHPPLGYTLSVPDRWAIIRYIRSDPF